MKLRQRKPEEDEARFDSTIFVDRGQQSTTNTNNMDDESSYPSYLRDNDRDDRIDHNEQKEDYLLTPTPSNQRDLDLNQILKSRKKAEKQSRFLKKATTGLVGLILLLAISNVCTSFISAILAKDTLVDLDSETMRISKTGQVIAVQSYGETFDLPELDFETKIERRTMVLRDLDVNPVGMHAHRWLVRKLDEAEPCAEGSTLCRGKITFDSGVMPQPQFNTLQQHCEAKRNVNVRKKWADGTSRTSAMCLMDSSIVVKPRKGKKGDKGVKDGKEKKVKGNGKDKKDNKKKTSSASSFTETEGEVEQKEQRDATGAMSNMVTMTNFHDRALRRRRKNQRDDDDCEDKEVVITTRGMTYRTECTDCMCYQSGSALLSRELEPCDIRLGDDDCAPGLICSKKKSGPRESRDLVGQCISAVVGVKYVDFGGGTQQYSGRTDLGEGDACEVALSSPCEAGLYCRPIGGVEDVYGICTAQVGAGVMTSSLGQEEGERCQMALEPQACVAGLYCRPIGGANAAYGVCTVEVSVFVSVSKRQGEGELCDKSFGDKACVNGFSCLSAGATNICVKDVQVASSTSSVSFTNTETYSIPKRQYGGMICDLSFGNKACVSGYTCSSRGKSSNFNTGECVKDVELKYLDAIPKFGEEGDICDIAYGNAACIDGFSCLVAGNARICVKDARVSSSVSVKNNDYDVSIPQGQAGGMTCDVNFGTRACVNGFSCIRTGNNVDVNVNFGECVRDPQVSSSVSIDTIVSIPEDQGEGEACNLSFGDLACITGHTCVESDFSTSAEVGVCVKDVATVIIPPDQLEGFVCDMTRGLKACADGLSCIPGLDSLVNTGYCKVSALPPAAVSPSTGSTYSGQGQGSTYSGQGQGAYGTGSTFSGQGQGGFGTPQGGGTTCDTSQFTSCPAGYICMPTGSSSSTAGVCTMIDTRSAPPVDADWWIDYEVHFCVRNCEKGKAPNCGGLRPAWDTNSYSSAEECCEQRMSWKRLDECVREYPIL